MIVRELIQLLQGCQQDMRVILKGYEGGFDDVGGVQTEEIVLNWNGEWYYGPHDSADQCDGKYDEKAVLLFRQRQQPKENVDE